MLRFRGVTRESHGAAAALVGGGATKAGSLLGPRDLAVQGLWLRAEIGCGGTGAAGGTTEDEDEEEGGRVSGVTTAGITEDEEGRTEEETENR